MSFFTQGLSKMAKQIYFATKNPIHQLSHRIGIALLTTSLCIILIFLSFFDNFSDILMRRVFYLNGHFQVIKSNLHEPYNSPPLTKDDLVKLQTVSSKAIQTIQPFAIKIGLLHLTPDDYESIILQGITHYTLSHYLAHYLIEGDISHPLTHHKQVHDVIISKQLANKWSLNLQDTLIIYFLSSPPRCRKVRIKAIYHTNLDAFDEKIIFTHIPLIQTLNHWSPDKFTGYQIFLYKHQDINSVEELISAALPPTLDLNNTIDNFPKLFDTLQLIAQNLSLISLGIILLASFIIFSVILTKTLTRAYMISLLHTLGTNYHQLSLIFLYEHLRTSFIGLLHGNILFCLIVVLQKIVHAFLPSIFQQQHLLFQLKIHLGHILLTNLFILIFTILSTIIATYIIIRMSLLRKRK